MPGGELDVVVAPAEDVGGLEDAVDPGATLVPVHCQEHVLVVAQVVAVANRG
jgi:hypothetical protein